ncbi:MAG: N-acetylneuraminate synthase family protein [Planctomycetes bacterium]|nr:N-acetylneuraminate synthase family protein [Planctomycetota bacterium]MBI3835488.1 N-acetylneuraminate synthase family protein [Planctomycetota bacterium]
MSDTCAKTIRLGNRIIGENQPVFVIAEAGVNHDGSVEEAFRLVDAAVDAKADAVKFQVFQACDLTTPSTPTAKYQSSSAEGAKSQRALLSRLELSIADFDRLKKKCDERKIIFLATPFGTEELDIVVRLGVPAIKIASTDLTNTILLAAAARTGLPLILSTGASTREEICSAAKLLRDKEAHERTTFLHCVSAYPTPIDSLNLRAIRKIQALTERPTGLSDHSTSIDSGAWAVAAGAFVIEKHLTMDRGASGPDHAMSLSPHEFTEYVAKIREVERALGTGEVGFQPLEADVRAVARRSVVANRSISRGEKITSDAITLKRPGTGIPPKDFQQVIGRTANRDIVSDAVLSWEMIS